MNCELCNRETEELEQVEDSFGNEDWVCESCLAAINTNKCIRCGGDTFGTHKHGLCSKCVQLSMASGENEASDGIVDNTTDIYDFLASDKMNKVHSRASDISGDSIPLSSNLLLNAWIYLKLREENIEECVNDHTLMTELDGLVRENITLLYGKPCKLIVFGRNDRDGKATICESKSAKFIEV